MRNKTIKFSLLTSVLILAFFAVNIPLQESGFALAQSSASVATFSKCQVIFGNTLTRPTCPSGWNKVYEYTESCVDHQELGTVNGRRRTLDVSSTPIDGAGQWCYKNEPHGDGGFWKQAAYSCAVCQKD